MFLMFLWAEAINDIWPNLILAISKDFQEKFYFWNCSNVLRLSNQVAYTEQ